MGMSEIMVTVVVATYNPNWSKLERTLRSILFQEGVTYEVIITDDGSEIDYFDKVTEHFENYSGIPFRLVKNEKNIGTVANICNCLQYTNGKYVFMTSPGDVLFDSRVLRDFVSFAEETQSTLLFGNAVNYSREGEEYNFGPNMRPPKPSAFDGTHSPLYEKTAFFFGNSILGAAYFRKREIAIKYFNEIKGISQYVEDTTSTACALLGGERLRYYDRNIVWYECNTGISGARNPVWERKLALDFNGVYRYLKKKYLDDVVFNQFYMENIDSLPKGIIRIITMCKHPLLLFYRMRIKMLQGVSIEYSKNEIEWFYKTEEVGEEENASN